MVEGADGRRNGRICKRKILTGGTMPITPKRPHVRAKFNIANNTLVIIREHPDGSQELLTTQGEWIPHTQKDEIFSERVKISDIYRYDPRSSPPD